MGAHPESTQKKKDETLLESIKNLSKMDHLWEFDSQMDLISEPYIEIMEPFSNIECMIIERAYQEFLGNKSEKT